jgi:tRNA threonylcarbamoyladenosine biosynthesis protein TsaE
VQWHTTSPEQTEAIGARFARACPSAADAFAVIYLTGDLGAGKTTFTRGFLRALGVTGPVRSPTYTLVENYAVGDRTIVHLDLYRLRDPSELEPLGLRELARPGHLWLVEWPEQGGGDLPPADIVMTLRAAPGGHAIGAKPLTRAGAAWVEAVQATN